MLKVIVIGLFIAGQLLAAPIIYGEDDRVEAIDYEQANQQEFIFANAAMISEDLMDETISENQKKSITLRTFGTLEKALNVCSDVRFSQQEVAASCSGFLIAPDLILTAGHCLKPNFVFEDPLTKCRKFKWVFGYAVTRKNEVKLNNISANKVYNCEDVIFSENDNDFAVVKLDRKVLNRSPLELNQKEIQTEAKLLTIGHPNGLPAKIAYNGRILANDEDESVFYTNLDTFQANSGSAVINEETGLVEGLVINGNSDYVLSDPTDPFSCYVENTCDEDGSHCLEQKQQSGEGVLKISKVLPTLLEILPQNPRQLSQI